MSESSVQLHMAPQQIVISVTGTVTEQTLTPLQEAVKIALAQSPVSAVIDLRQVTEIDSKVLSLLHATGQRFVHSMRGLTIHTTAGTQPARVLELSRMEELLTRLCGSDAPNLFAIVTDASE